MLKLANQVLDAYDDTGYDQLRKVAAARPQTHFRSPAELAQLHDSDFALHIITKKASKLSKFPVATKDDAWLSDTFFAMNHERLPKLAAEKAAFFIKKACDRHGLTPSKPVLVMAKEAASNVFFEGDGELKAVAYEPQVDLSKFAAAEDIGNNYTAAQFVMKTPAHVKVAGQYFADMHEKMPRDVRHKYAAAIQRRAHELGMPAQGGTVAKYASDHYSGMVDAHVRSRVAMLDGINKEAQDNYERLSAAKTRISPSAFAQALHGLDKQAGLSRHYGSALEDPYIATFGKEPDPYATWRYKSASANLGIDDLQRLAVGAYPKIKENFGMHVADEFKKHPMEIFESLPNDAKAIIGEIAAGNL